MINILIPNINNKFYRNLSITNITDVRIVTENIQRNIYNLYYKHQFNTLIIPSSLIDNSILQFCVEFKDHIKTIIDVDSNLNEEFLRVYNTVFHFLIHPDQTKIYEKYNHINKPLYLLNDELYIFNTEITKINFIACFLDHVPLLQTKLIESLYPNTKSKIRLFNNPNINHPQNLGMVNELEKSLILKEAEYYLDIDNGSYSIEAQAAGCKIINLNSINTLEPIIFETPTYTTYRKFLQDYIVI